MLKSFYQKLSAVICVMALLSSCAHYGHHEKCVCGKDKMTCAHHQDGKGTKADEECTNCKK